MYFRRRLGRWALALVVSALAAPALTAQTKAETSPNPEVTKLDFVGVSDAVDKELLRLAIYTEPTRCRSFALALFCKFTNYRGFEERHYLDRKELQRDVFRIRLFYYLHGFREASVDTTVTRIDEKAVAVAFRIVEGPPTVVSNVEVAFDSTVIPARRARQLTLVKQGDNLDLYVIDSTRLNFQNDLWERGYADALIDTSTVVDATGRTARVRFQIVPNRLSTVGEIVIRGTDQVSPATVLNTVALRPGDLFKRSAVLESQRNLYESNLFRLAVLDVPQTFDSVKTVNILVREAPMHEARTSVGFNTVDYLQTEGRYTAYNLFGGARRLDVTATVGNLAAGQLNGAGIFRKVSTDSSITDSRAFLSPNWHAAVDFRQPAWLQHPRNALALGAFAQRSAVPAVVIDRSYGGHATFTRSFGLRAPASLDYRFEVTRVQAGGPYFCVNFGVCDTVTVGALRSHQRLSPLVAQFQVDRSDQPLNPTRGHILRAEVEHASQLTISDYRYNRVYAEGSLYSRAGWKSAVLATHLRLGFVRAMGGGPSTEGEAVLHPRKRFYAGGSQSVRGYGENQLGPRVLTLPHEYLLHGRTAQGAPCDPTTEAIRFCDPNFATDSTSGDAVGDDKFTPRALGGTSLIEGSVEYRFPLPLIDNLQAAVFIDGAAVGERSLDLLAGVETLRQLVRGTWAITPGFGIRYLSTVGPIRVDLGFNPTTAQDLAVVTELTRNGRTEIIPLEMAKRYSPMGSSGGIGGFLNRFTLHLSIGQAY